MPEEETQARVDAALAAGGHLVRDDYAPAWWTLADKYGNEIDVASIAYRDGPPPEG
jgi:4a-hydroxytetrahydrobiopterin dehydratase